MVLVAFADFEFEGLTSDDLVTLQPAFGQNLYAGDLVEMAKLGLLDAGRRDGKTASAGSSPKPARSKPTRRGPGSPPTRSRSRRSSRLIGGPGSTGRIVAEELRERLHEVEVERDRLAERVHDLEAERAAAKVSRDEIRAFLRGDA
jgi:hypothetical protein